MPIQPNRIRLVACAVVLLGLLTAACGDTDKSAPSTTQAALPPAIAITKSDGTVVPNADRALRISTQSTLAAGDVVVALDALRSAVASAGGYVSDAKVTSSGEHASAELEARIPVAALPGFRATVGELGSVLSDTEKAEDVTEQRADLGARLRNARAQEKRLLALLSDRTGNLADVIAAEKALGESRDLVERLEAEEQTLAGQIAHATVKVRIVPKQEVAPATPRAMISSAASKGVTIAGQVVVSSAVVLVTVAPTLLMLVAIGAVVFLAARPIAKRWGAGARSVDRAA